MNIGEVRHLSNKLARHAEEIGTIVASVSSMLSSTTWVGPDVSKVRDDWPAFRSALAAFCESLTEAALQASHNADLQESASNAI